jgi:hypothetical protein
MLKPLIVIGCGGSGVNTLRYLRKSAKEALAKVGWDGPLPQAWQFIGVDIGVQYPNDPFETEPIPDSDYICVGRGASYRDIQSVMEAKHFPGRPGYLEMLGWKPSAAEITPPITTSVGMFRPVGRMAGLAALMPQLSHRLMQAYVAIKSSSEEFHQITNLLTGSESSGNPKDMEPLVIVLGSMAGGTGSAIMLDINELVQRLNAEFALIFNVVYSADIFESLGQGSNPSLHANSLAFMSELLAFTWNGRKSSDLIEHREKKEYIVPPLTFIVERTNLSGQQMSNSHKDSFQQIASWLTGVAISPDEQLPLMWAINRHAPHSSMTSGGYGLEKSSIYDPPGAIYSLGHAKISVGRDRYPEYASKLLQRATVDFLLNAHGATLDNRAKNQPATSMVEGIRQNAENMLQTFLVGAQMSVSSELEEHFIERMFNEIDTNSLSRLVKLELQNETDAEINAGFNQKTGFNNAVMNVRNQNLQRNSDLVSNTVRELKDRVLDGITREVIKSLSTRSMPVVSEVLKITQRLIDQTASQIRLKAADQIRKSELELIHSIDALDQTGKRTLGVRRKYDKNHLDFACNHIVFLVQSQCLDYLAAALEELSNYELTQITRRLDDAIVSLQSDFEEMADWPKLDQQVPYWLRSSPFEVCLEGLETWPNSLRDQMVEFRDPNEDTDEHMIRNAIVSILNGGYESRDGKLTWPLFELLINRMQEFVYVQSIESRVEDWLRRQGAGFEAFVHEGIQSYLADYSWTNKKSSDNEHRIKRFAEAVDTVLEACQPLIQVDEKLAADVYRNSNSAIKAYPYFQSPFFGNAANDILKKAMEKRFPELEMNSIRHYSGGESNKSSFEFTSFLRNPLNPSVFKRFTESQAIFVHSRVDSAAQWGYVHKWRRTRKLSEYIPLPEELRQAAIRGFAVGRILGYITNDTNEPIKISGMDREYTFPRRLLTPSGPRNLLPALLESMSLCFADVPIHGQEAFGAYREMISLGVGSDGSPNSFVFENECLKYITTGSRLRIPVDTKRVEMMSAETPSERQYKMVAYLNDNLSRYEEVLASVKAAPDINFLSADDKLSIELIEDLLPSYQMVIDSVRRYVDETCIDYF